jgi:transposase-like protein
MAVCPVSMYKRRDRKAALKFLRKSMKRHGQPHVIVTDKLRSYGAAMKIIGNSGRQETGRWLNNRSENSHQPFDDENWQCSGFGACEVYRNSHQFTPPSTTI